ncbi:hypothetical protein AXZ95_2774 [Leifsonia sp. 115AMFTsu3.1]|nr:hypothetical protein AXZ95_2774 [Leifsonia sp. 115AMFTsu3.1]
MDGNNSLLSDTRSCQYAWANCDMPLGIRQYGDIDKQRLVNDP